MPADRPDSPRSAGLRCTMRSPARPGSFTGSARRPAVLLLVAACGLAAALPACGEDGEAGEHPLVESRTYEPVGRPIRWNATAAERHGISARDFAGGAASGDGQGGGAMGGAAGSGASSPGAAGGDGMAEGAAGDMAGPMLHWTTPAGWQERPAAMFRDANFFVAGDERAECYLTTLGGEAGGLAANVNRWRSQLSLPALSDAEVAALPRVSWLGTEAAAVDFTGRWKGMSGDQAREGWRLVGRLSVSPEQSRFLKMVGPQEVIGPAVGAFNTLADSFHESANGAPHGSAGQGTAAAGNVPPAAAPELPPDHPPLGAAPSGMPGAGAPGVGAGAAGPGASGSGTPGTPGAPASGTSGAVSATSGPTGEQATATAGEVPFTAVPPVGAPEQTASLAWHAPPGWTRGPEKAMRDLTYFAGPGGAAECTVTLLAGDGGGLLANINRWCGQLGAPPLAASDLAGLEHVPMAGGDGVLVRLERGPGATAPAGAELLIGAVCLLPGRALFVKMTGPRDAVAGQRPALVEFCKSLRTR